MGDAVVQLMEMLPRRFIESYSIQISRAVRVEMSQAPLLCGLPLGALVSFQLKVR